MVWVGEFGRNTYVHTLILRCSCNVESSTWSSFLLVFQYMYYVKFC